MMTSRKILIYYFESQCIVGRRSLLLWLVSSNWVTMMWMLRALWLFIARDLFEYRYMDDATGNLLSLFCSTWFVVLKMFVRLFRIKANESLEKCLAGAIYKEEKWWNWDKRALDHLRMPKLQEIFTTVAIVCYRYERLAVLQNVFAIVLVWARKDVEKRFEKKSIQER